MTRAACLLALGLSLLLAAGAAAQPSPSAVRIAVLDSGIDAAHTELAGRVAERHSFVAPTLPPAPGVGGLPLDPFSALLDPDGQGTAVASKVAGKTLGVAPDALLVDLQVSGRYTGTGLDPAAEEAALAAMDWLLAHHGGNRSDGPRVALLSFADAEPTGPGAASLAAQAQQLWDEGVLVVVPAGGNGTLHTSPHVLTIGGTESVGSACAVPLAPSMPIKPDLVAPAQDVEAAVATRTPADSTSATALRSGTPYAAAAVAGVAAQAWAARADLPLPALAAILRDQARDVGPAGPDGCGGFGALDGAAVLEAVMDWSDPRPREPLSKPAPPAPAVALALIALLAAGLRRRVRSPPQA